MPVGILGVRPRRREAVLVRLAVVGMKGIGRTHAEAIASLDGCELAACCDVVAEEARACSERHGCPAFSDLDEMLAKARPDGVCVCTPHWFHPPIALKAFARGVHVLTEKPLAVTVGDGERMIEAARAAELRLGVVFQHRTDPMNVKAREIVSSGRIGEIHRTMLTAAWFRPEAYYRSGAWRGTWAGEGGGVLLNQAPHTLDLFIWISGMMPDRLCGSAEAFLHEIEVEDRASALLHYPGGATGYVHASTAEFPNSSRMEFAGDRGKLVLDEGLGLTVVEPPTRKLSRTAAEPWSTPEATAVDLGPDASPKESAGELKPVGGHDLVIADFAAAIREGRDPAVSGEEALKSLELANAITLSSHRREEVALPVPRRAYTELIELLAGKGRRRRRGKRAAKKRPQR